MKKEIVFGPSVGESLRAAQHTGIGDNSISGCANDIICLEYNLAFGDISEKNPSDKRYQYLYKSISTMYPAEIHGSLAKDWIDDLKKKNQRYLTELKTAIKNEKEIRIWYSSAPDEINAFYWLMSFLDSQKHYKNISAVFISPDYWSGSYYCRGTAMLGPEMYYEALKLEKEITENQIKNCSDRWKELRRENAPMRLMVSGNLVSLPEDFLDSFIRNTINKFPEKFTIAGLVGEVMGAYELMVGDFSLYERVLCFAERGEIEIMEECKEKPMATRVRKSFCFISD
ncbi:MAG: DUF1835 domain-containing protein [Lachnospiraceae bacterium]|nr:DUF1835 domain-containing protein [Lachnospiraceae bacterium]